MLSLKMLAPSQVQTAKNMPDTRNRNRLEHQQNQQIPLLEMFAADLWRKYTAIYAPYHSSHVQCHVPLDTGWTAGHDVPDKTNSTTSSVKLNDYSK